MCAFALSEFLSGGPLAEAVSEAALNNFMPHPKFETSRSGAGPARDHEMDIQTQSDDYSGSLFLRCSKTLPQAVKEAARS